MDIGVTYSSNPAKLVQASGEFLSNNIRDIGRQVQSTILEINTKKDLARFAQNLQQNVNPNSEDFAQQAVQVAANHPLAIQDPRGQIALNILGKAHGEWKNAQTLVNRFGQQQALAGIRNENALGQIAARTAGQLEAEQIRQSGRKDLANLRQDQQKEILDIRNEDVLGQIEARANAAASKPMTPYQQAQIGRMTKKDQVDAIKTEITQLDRDIASHVSQYEKSFKREQEAQGEEKLRHQADKTEIGKIADELKKKKEDRLKALRDLESAAVEETNADMLPPVTPNAAAPAPGVRRVPVFDPSGQPLNIREDQLDAALQAGWKRR